MTELQLVTMFLLMAIILMMIAIFLIICKKIAEAEANSSRVIDTEAQSSIPIPQLRIVNAA